MAPHTHRLPSCLPDFQLSSFLGFLGVFSPPPLLGFLRTHCVAASSSFASPNSLPSFSSSGCCYSGPLPLFPWTRHSFTATLGYSCRCLGHTGLHCLSELFWLVTGTLDDMSSSLEAMEFQFLHLSGNMGTLASDSGAAGTGILILCRLWNTMIFAFLTSPRHYCCAPIWKGIRQLGGWTDFLYFSAFPKKNGRKELLPVTAVRCPTTRHLSVPSQPCLVLCLPQPSKYIMNTPKHSHSSFSPNRTFLDSHACKFCFRPACLQTGFLPHQTVCVLKHFNF